MAVTKTNEIPDMRRYNFKRADWNNFTKNLDRMITDIVTTNEKYDNFIDQVKFVSR